jgi:hypothetical protein
MWNSTDSRHRHRQARTGTGRHKQGRHRQAARQARSQVSGRARHLGWCAPSAFPAWGWCLLPRFPAGPGWPGRPLTLSDRRRPPSLHSTRAAHASPQPRDHDLSCAPSPIQSTPLHRHCFPTPTVASLAFPLFARCDINATASKPTLSVARFKLPTPRIAST